MADETARVSDHGTLQIATFADLGELLPGRAEALNVPITPACEAVKVLKLCELVQADLICCCPGRIRLCEVGMTCQMDLSGGKLGSEVEWHKVL